ncbi:MAG: hypothetical protein CL912_33655 [Deltaproteobacteria bacterium]|nr:hypothetical protein [Deltaproteobacteria bacterium]
MFEAGASAKISVTLLKETLDSAFCVLKQCQRALLRFTTGGCCLQCSGEGIYYEEGFATTHGFIQDAKAEEEDPAFLVDPASSKKRMWTFEDLKGVLSQVLV